MTKKLTKRQNAVLECIKDYIDQNGYGPTVRDLCKMMGLSSPSTIHVHLKSLEELGYINRDERKSRSITLSDSVPGLNTTKEASSTFAKTIDVPLVGNVAAGQPILADQNITDTLSMPVDIVGDSASFMLSVHGDSMIEVGINDGDYVVVKEQPIADNGDIVVALIDEGATVKRFFREDNHIRLQPENRHMEPIIIDNCAIAGKVVAVFRRL